jgi:hypothetical protein
LATNIFQITSTPAAQVALSLRLSARLKLAAV